MLGMETPVGILSVVFEVEVWLLIVFDILDCFVGPLNVWCGCGESVEKVISGASERRLK